MSEFIEANKGLSRAQIINQLPSRGFMQEGGPKMRYIIDPRDNSVIDMRHLLILGDKPLGIQIGVEVIQLIGRLPRAFKIHDLLSNLKGSEFYSRYDYLADFFAPMKFTDYIQLHFYGK